MTSKAQHMHGLAAWVRDYQECRKAGNVEMAIEIRDSINRVIACEGLDPTVVWGDDPDARR